MLRGHVQVLLNKLRGFSAQSCLDAPRFCISAGLPESGATQASSAGNMDSEIYFEEGIPNEVIEELRSEYWLSLSPLLFLFS
jgi:gamma-glutamyltranspeptidase/glutathione hydrolase